MKRIPAESIKAQQAYDLVTGLQQRFVQKLTEISGQQGDGRGFEAVEWFRDGGVHGGGVRYEARDEKIFDRGSVNVSQVQYEDDPAKTLASATAISTIIHPRNPLAPSVHIHISWTELKSGEGYWRIMADLNPAITNEADKQTFTSALEQAAPEQYASAAAQGDRYFFIPALNRHRGVTHFYLESYSSGDFAADFELATKLGEVAIDTFYDILKNALQERTTPSAEDNQQQLAYHTLYFFQVLTLDRGTTSGLLIHDENDVGIMGSLPSHVNKSLLSSWKSKVEKPQDELLQALLDCLPDEDVCIVDVTTKKKLANAVRQFYQVHPDAIALQASGNVVPATVAQHQSH